jgi:sugar-phosphatase
MRFDVQAVLFDVDGTLVDSTAAVERTWRTWAARHDIEASTVLRICHGRRTEDTVAQFVAEELRAGAVAEVEDLDLHDLVDVVALPGARDLLPRLASDRWAAVTSGSRALMAARLGAAGLPVPQVLVAAEDVRHGKPDPEGYLKAAAELGRDIRECLVIEDAPAGVEAALAAGARVLGVATSHSAADLDGADFVVADLASCTMTSSSDGVVLTAGS